MERPQLLDWGGVSDAVDSSRTATPWEAGPVRMGRTRTVYIDEPAGVVYKIDRVRGTNTAERHELELLDGLDGIPDWTWVEIDGATVIIMEFIPGTHPERLDPTDALVRALAAENADLHPANFVVDENGKLWCIDLGS